MSAKKYWKLMGIVLVVCTFVGILSPIISCMTGWEWPKWAWASSFIISGLCLVPGLPIGMALDYDERMEAMGFYDKD